MSALDATAAVAMIGSASRRLTGAADELSRLDAVAGDGDHGLNVAAAFGEAAARLASRPPSTAADGFRTLGAAFSEAGGGSAGALFGVFFQSLADELHRNPRRETASFVDGVELGVRRVAELGRAAPGDKTMLDALAPAARAARSTFDGGGDLGSILDAAAAAAIEGAASTAAMRAMAGRARYAEAGAIGTRDPGAQTVALMFAAWSASVAGNAAPDLVGSADGPARPGSSRQDRVEEVDR